MLTLYQQAAATCPGLSWAILAAIGTRRPCGVHRGNNAAGAEGPMQLEPANFPFGRMSKVLIGAVTIDLVPPTGGPWWCS